MSTGGQIIDNVLDQLEESRTSPTFWTRAELLQHLNDAIAELNLMTAKYQSSRSFTVQLGTFQDTPVAAIAILHISRSYLFLRKTTLEYQDRDKRKWQAETSPEVKIKEWGPVGLTKFFVRPRNLAATDVVTLVTLDYPTTIGETDVIPIDEEYVCAVRDYTFHMARFKEGGKEFSDSMKLYDDFRERVGSLMERKLSEQYALWAKEAAADTGPRLSTTDRS